MGNSTKTMNFHRFFVALTIAAVAIVPFSCGSPEPKTGYESFTAENHPRIFFTAKDFKDIKKAVARNENPILTSLHEQLLKTADDLGLSQKELKYGRDASGRRLTTNGTGRLVSAAYAYKMTGDKKYLDHVEWDLKCVCNYPDWVPDHFLGAATMSIGVGLAYDWLYNDLSQETKDLVVKTLRSHSIDPSLSPDPSTSKEWWWHSTSNNWNQVCECGLATAAFAIYETCPEIAKAVIEKAGSSNVNAMKSSYSPDGAYPEGSTYWEYGTEFQCIMISALESALGSDFGICSSEGFDKTADYQMHSVSNTLERFNYSDCGSGFRANPALWFFAVRFNKPDVLYLEKAAMERKAYVDNRTLFLALTCAAKADFSAIPVPDKNMYTGAGITPVAMMRTGWDKEDLYLGVKGGKSSNPHGHMDIGEFVFDAYGYRWAVDYGQPEYSIVESFFIKELGSSPLFNGRQTSPRWDLFSYNNKQHNTLTINDKNHVVEGLAKMTDTWSDANRMGAAFDMTPVFGDDVASVRREASIRDGKYLEVADAVTAGAKPTKVRFTLATNAQVQLEADGIVLTQENVKMKLQTEGAKVTYKIWPITAETVGPDPEDFLKHCAGASIIGYEVTLPKGASTNLVTTLKRGN